MSVRTLVLTTGFVALATLSSQSQAKDVSLCNGSPVKVFTAVGFNSGQKAVTKGWYSLSPGKCRTWSYSGTDFYYYAESQSRLARWLNDGSPMKWDGWHRRCVNYVNAFEKYGTGNCDQAHRFSKVVLPHDQNRFTLYEQNHIGVQLQQVPSLRRSLLGRMEFESILRSNNKREAPFQLGIGIANHRQGVRIEKVYAGMPAETEGLETGDVISALNGYRIRNVKDLHWIMDNVSLFQSEPLPMSIVRDGQKVSGAISPLFYEFNHKDYDPNGGFGTFLWSTVNGIAFGFGNELGCGAAHGLAEGISSLLQDRDFKTSQTADEVSDCSSSLNRELAKNEILYEKAATAGFWASLLAPGIPAGKLLKAGKGVPLAARSRFVAR